MKQDQYLPSHSDISSLVSSVFDLFVSLEFFSSDPMLGMVMGKVVAVEITCQ